jgi:acetylornithine deacetylase/succinyl-diaminopimelate desuccinylase-like protein
MEWQAARDEALDIFRQLLRVRTENPPGNEMEAVELLASKLADDGIEAETMETAPGRGNMVARLKGREARSSALVLASHLDVVSASGQSWLHPPFDAEVADGYVWGRGAVDMKHMAAMSVMVLKLLKRQGKRLKRDVVFAGVSDEETGGEHGAARLCEERPELVEGEYLLGEVGGFNVPVGEAEIVPIQVAEKGRVLLRLRAEGPAGHGSLPVEGSAVGRLGRAVDRLARIRLPIHVTRVARAFIREVAASQGLVRGSVMRQLANPSLSQLILDRAISEPGQRAAFQAMLSNTATPTMLTAGEASNVVPEGAEALVDGRFLPGQTASDLIREVRSIVGPSVTIEKVCEQQPVELRPFATAAYRALCDTVRQNAPKARPVPSLTPGYTDAKHFSKLGLKCYGFTPLWFDRRSGLVAHRLFHAPDERAPVEGFNWGLKVLYEAVCELCAEESK